MLWSGEPTEYNDIVRVYKLESRTFMVRVHVIALFEKYVCVKFLKIYIEGIRRVLPVYPPLHPRYYIHS